jgi:hypothetical protein
VFFSQRLLLARDSKTSLCKMSSHPTLFVTKVEKSYVSLCLRKEECLDGMHLQVGRDSPQLRVQVSQHLKPKNIANQRKKYDKSTVSSVTQPNPPSTMFPSHVYRCLPGIIVLVEPIRPATIYPPRTYVCLGGRSNASSASG